MGPIKNFLYYEESLVSSNLNSKLLWFDSVRPNLDIYSRSIIDIKTLYKRLATY